MKKKPALVVIDVQQGFDDSVWGKRNNPQAEANVARLLSTWRESGCPIVHVQHESKSEHGSFRPGSKGHAHKLEALPLHGERVYHKTVNSAFIGTTLEADLRRDGIDGLVICGLVTNHCVSTTARMSGNLGFETYVVSDATAAFDRQGPDGMIRSAEEVHSAALSDLHEEFAIILTTAEAQELALRNWGDMSERSDSDTASALSANGPASEVQGYIDRMHACLGNREPVAVLGSTVSAIEEWLIGADLATLATKPRPNKWSAQEILAHLADTEVVLSVRLRQMLTHDGVAIQPYDQDRWAAVSNYDQIPAHESVQRFSVNRRANLALVRSLDSVQRGHEGVHAERGRGTVAEMLRMWAGHDLNHLAQLSSLIH